MARISLLHLFGSAGATTKVAGAALLLIAAASATYAASTANSGAKDAKAGLTVQSSPLSQTASRGQTVYYTVSVSSVNGLAGSVALSAAGLPAGAGAQFAPASLSLTAGATSTSTFSVATTSSTALGSASPTVIATSGKISNSLSLGLTVSAATTSAVSVSASPASVTMAPGAMAVYTIAVARTDYSGPVTFAVTGLPAGASAGFAPNPATGTSATLQVSTSDTMKDGSYSLGVVATGSGGLTGSAAVQLVLQTSGKPFTISGTLAGLSPGTSLPLNLTLTNQNKKQISISNLTVTVQSVTPTQEAISRGQSCTTADYAVLQYSGGYPLALDGLATATLAGLRVAQSAQPHIVMRDTTTNQDGCKGATVNLAYSGSGQGS